MSEQESLLINDWPTLRSTQKKNVADLEEMLTRVTDLCEYSEKTINLQTTLRPSEEDTLRNPLLLSVDPLPTTFGFEEEKRSKKAAKLCFSPECYSAYMGYKFEEVKASPCGGTTCKIKTPLNLCSGEVCVFPPTTANLPPGLDWTRNKCCGSLICPHGKNKTKTKLPSLHEMYSSNNVVPCPYAPPPTCGGAACPLENQTIASTSFDDTTSESLVPVGLCGQATCPFASTEYAKRLQKFDENLPCGDPTCRRGGQIIDVQTLCGRESCPFNTRAEPAIGAPCGNDTCQFGTAPKPKPVIPCPFAAGNKTSKRYPCGSPSCPYVNPSGMIYTHQYDHDYSFVQESARPYSGSACPYDYLTSLGAKYPSPIASNYPTFVKSNVCGSPACPYTVEKEENVCDDTTCEEIKKQLLQETVVICEECGGILSNEELTETEGLKIKKEWSEDANDSEETKDDDDDEEEEVKDVPVVIEETNNVEVVNKDEGAKRLEEMVETKIKKTPRKKRKDKISLYSYPGVQIGHKECGLYGPNIPANMGWLWNIKPSPGNPELWRGYKPGAISRAVYKIIKAHRRSLGFLDLTTRKKKSQRKFKMEDLKHYVEVKKKEGDFTIVVNPVKDPKKLEPYENPFMEVTPIQFRVEKEPAKKEPAYCPCDEGLASESVESFDSEMEFHFSPPAAIPNQKPRKRKVMKTMEVQYNKYDLSPEYRTSKSTVKSRKGKKKKKKKKAK